MACNMRTVDKKARVEVISEGYWEERDTEFHKTDTFFRYFGSAVNRG